MWSQGVADILLGYGITWADLHAVLLGHPAALRVDPTAVRLALKLLADFGVGFDKARG